MISEILLRARQYESENEYLADKHRPEFHATGTIGWINDPNGFSVYKGEYHLFYQYHPYSTQWGPMHWGHMKTKDFIKWERLPVAIAPDCDYDKDGCYSGSAIELPDGRQLLMYTGVVKETHEDGSVEEFQHQCIAIGDGINYEKIDNNPVLDIKDIPDGGDIHDFRDPKIWKDGEDYYAVIGNRACDGSGSIPMYTSKDGILWSYVKTIDTCNNRYGSMWECPDFFELDNKQILVVSPMDMEAEGLEFHGGHGVVVIGGLYDKQNHDFKREWVQACDYGIDFYAPQTLLALDGRRIMIGWMRNWETTNLRPDNCPIFGSMTIPRELTVIENRLYINPVKEIEKYRNNLVHYENVEVKEPIQLNGISGRIFDMTVSVTSETQDDYSFFRMVLGKDEKHGASIIYRPKENTVTFDRTLASKRFDTLNCRSFYVNNHDGKIKLRIIMDKDSIELFVNDGEAVATFLIYNDISADGIEFEADKKVYIDVAHYTFDF